MSDELVKVDELATKSPATVAALRAVTGVAALEERVTTVESTIADAPPPTGGAADTATRLAAPVRIFIQGAVDGAQDFDGSDDLVIPVELAPIAPHALLGNGGDERAPPTPIALGANLQLLNNVLSATGGAGGAVSPLAITGSLTSGTLTGDVITGAYSITGGLGPYRLYSNGPFPPGLVLNAAGVSSGRYTDAGDFTYVVNVQDALGSHAFHLEHVVITEGVAVGGAVGDLGKNADVTGAYTSTGGTAPYVYSHTGTLPDGMALAADGTRSGKVNTAGTYNYTVISTDANGHTGKLVETVIVSPVVITVTGATGNVINGHAVTGAYVVGGNGSGPMTFTASNLPPGMQVAADGTKSGTVTTNGTYNVAVTVTDINGETGSFTDKIVVGTLTVANTALQANVGNAYSGGLALGGVYLDTVTALSDDLPAWVTSVSINNKKVVFTGTPTALGTTDTFHVTVTDGAGQVVELTLTIDVVPTIVIIGGALGTLYIGGDVSGQYTASNGKPPFTFSYTGTLPDGMSIAADGTRSGTLTAVESARFKVTVTDAYGSTGELIEDVAVLPKPYAAWSDTLRNDEITLSDGVRGNSVATYNTAGTTGAMTLSDVEISGKTYVEAIIKAPSASKNAGFGWVRNIPDFLYDHNAIGNQATCAGIYAPSGAIAWTYNLYSVPLVAESTGTYRVGMAVDPATGMWWVTNDGATWVVDQDGIAGNPVAGTNSLAPPIVGDGTAHFAASPTAVGNTVEIIADPTQMAWNAPTGFTKGLAQPT